MTEQTAWLLFGIVAVIVTAITLTAIVTLNITVAGEEWIACIEAGRSMVNGVCL